MDAPCTEAGEILFARRMERKDCIKKYHYMKKAFIILVTAMLLSTSCSNNQKPSTDSEQTVTETAETLRQKPWQQITPREIEGNPVEMFADDWFELAAGKEGDMNLMTIAWGGLGQLWGKPVVTVYVSTSRYTNTFMEKNDYFTITHFPASMKEILQYLGTASGRDEDKVKGADLTVEFTELGNPIFAEANLAIECKKIYAEQFKAELLPLEQRQWYEERGIGIHVAYIGEIVGVWKK